MNGVVLGFKYQNMSALFNELPGVYIPLKDFMSVRRDWWAENGTLQDFFQVCQFNFILHFGYDINIEEGLAVFQNICELTRDYPCRVWVICPQKEAAIGIELKLFGICHLSLTGFSQKRICEAIIVKAGGDDLLHLYDWISARSDNDLPLYFLSQKALEQIDVKTLNPLLYHAKKILWDSSIEHLPSGVHFNNDIDLREASLRPLKNAMASFLANYAPEILVNKLQSIAIHSHPENATAKLIATWLQERLKACVLFIEKKPHLSSESPNEKSFAFTMEYHSSVDLALDKMQIQLHYEDATKFLKCSYSHSEKKLIIEANLDERFIEVTQSIMLLDSQEALKVAIWGNL